MSSSTDRSPRDTNPATICAQLTPRGRGAVAVIAVFGAAAEPAIDQFFLPANGQSYSRSGPGKIVYGVWIPTGEDLVVCRRGDEQFEVHCHGGNSASSAIIESLQSKGVTEVSPLQFSGTIANPWEVSTQLALTRSTTKRTAEFLLGQMERLPNAIQQLGDLIEKGQHEQAIAELEAALNWSSFGIHLTQPRSIVLCGQTNVGKSSLVNAIVGFQRAIVHRTAGTTRDVVSQSTAIDGWPVELKDTAGLRDATNPIEVIGIEKARDHIATADLKICVFDASIPWSADDQQMIASINPNLIVHNKSDLVDQLADTTDRPQGIATSVIAGTGIGELIEHIGSQLVPSLPDSNQVFPVTQEQVDKLKEVLRFLRAPGASEPPELVSSIGVLPR